MQKMIKNHLKLILVLLSMLMLSACAPSNTQYTSGFGTPKKIRQYKQAGDLWSALSSDFNLPDESTDNPAVRYEINWFMAHPHYVVTMAQQAEPYLYYIFQQVKKRGLPGEVALMPMIESAYNPFAINAGSGASGLWQMEPSTASGFGIHVNWWYDGRRDIVASTNGALDYLSYLGNFFNGRWLLAIAAYDTGEGNVQDSMRRNSERGKNTDFWALELPKETQAYVPKILALATIIKYPSRYPINLPYIPNAPYLAKVNVGSQIDLARAAKLAGISLKALSALNPGFNRWATAPNGPFTLLLPIDKSQRFKNALKKLPRRDRVTWRRVIVKSGDTLYDIARNSNTSARLIAQINNVNDNDLQIGQTLLIPNRLSAVTKLVISDEQRYFKTLHSIPEPNVIHYHVRAGDSLSGIAKSYHVKAFQIRFWNGMKNNTIAPGMKLTIWPPKKEPWHLYYTYIPYQVKAGNTLIGIADQFHVPVLTLKAVNYLQSDMLRLHQVLRVPIAHYAHRIPRHMTTHIKLPRNSYQVEPGDTLYQISDRFNVSLKSLKAANNLKNDTLHMGQILRIPVTRTYRPANYRASNLSNHSRYIVHSGDSLYAIAIAHGISVHALKAANHLSNNTIRNGEALILPKKQTANAAHHKKIISYTIKPGDTLYEIAAKYKVRAKEIEAWNHIRNVDTIRPGLKLVIYQ